VPVKGSFAALATGALLYVCSTCSFGQVVSTFTSVGTFTKGLGFSDLWFNALVLVIFTAGYFTASHLFLHKQET